MATRLNLDDINPLYLAAGVAIIAAIWYLKKNGVQGTTYNLASGAVGVAADALNGIISGTVVGIGQTVGISATDQGACAKAKAAGSTWDASFACPAGDFLKWLYNGKPAN